MTQTGFIRKASVLAVLSTLALGLTARAETVCK
jgi:hypothetical protein